MPLLRRFTESVFFKDVLILLPNFHAAVYPKEGLQKGETTEALGSVILCISVSARRPCSRADSKADTFGLWRPLGLADWRCRFSGMALRLCQQVVLCCYYVVLLLCCAVFMKIMKWHYHIGYIYIHIPKSHCVQRRGNSRYSSKQLFLKSFAESRFLRNALETIAEQSFPFYEVLNQVDWNTLQKAFDALVAPSLWAHTSALASFGLARILEAWSPFEEPWGWQTEVSEAGASFATASKWFQDAPVWLTGQDQKTACIFLTSKIKDGLPLQDCCEEAGRDVGITPLCCSSARTNCPTASLSGSCREKDFIDFIATICWNGFGLACSKVSSAIALQESPGKGKAAQS